MTVADLQNAAIVDLEPEAPAGDMTPGETKAGQYIARPSGLYRRRWIKDGDEIEPARLTNFICTIRAETVEDDGAEETRTLDLDVTMNGRSRSVRVPARDFGAMNWPIEHLGASAIVYPQQGPQARTAIQELSAAVAEAGIIPERRVFAHTGWRELDGAWYFLHAGGAIGADGPNPALETALSGTLAGYRLPIPPEGDALIEAIRASLALARTPNLIAPALMVPLLGAVYRAPLPGCDFGVFVEGRTGIGKSEAAALAQQHYGSDMDARHLPESWSSSDNAIEANAFRAKDAILVIDDFKPGGALGDVQRLHQKADRIFRNLGNHAGRGRLYANLRYRPVRAPRGLIIGTGEDVPNGESLRARLVIVEAKLGDVTLGPALAEIQSAASRAILAAAMAGYLRWLAPRYPALAAGAWRNQRDVFRAQMSGTHARTPDAMANLALGWSYFLTFAREAGALSEGDHAALWECTWGILAELGASQSRLQAEDNPVRRFFELLAEALASGKAHLASRDGGRPDPYDLARTCGWRNDDGDNDWKALGDRIGWVDGDDLYLLPEASHKAATEMAKAGAGSLTIGARTLGKRLQEAKLLVSVTSRDERRIERRFGGAKRDVLHLSLDTLYLSTGSPTSPTGSLKSPDGTVSAVGDPEKLSPTVGDLSPTLPGQSEIAVGDTSPTVGDPSSGSPTASNRHGQALWDGPGGDVGDVPEGYRGVAEFSDVPEELV